MKDKKKYIDNKIQEKIKQHEFEFSDHAWEQMEELMDSPPPSTKSNSLTFRIFLAMLLILIIFWFGWWNFSQTNHDTNQEILTEQVKTKQNVDKNEIAVETYSLEHENLKESNNTTIKNETKPTTKNVQASDLTLPVKLDPFVPFSFSNNQTANSTFIQTTPIDSIFYLSLQEQLKLYQETFAPEKVYLQFDRTQYKPGESVWFNAFVRDANTFKASKKSDLLYVELIAPNGKVEKKLTLIAKNGMAAGDLFLNENFAGGTYKIKAYTNWQKNLNDFIEREIQVQKSVLPNLRMELEFQRKAYGANDEVLALLDLKTLDNKILANYEFEYVASLDGKQFVKLKAQTDADGHANIKLKLPNNLNTNDGLLNIQIPYNGQTESIARSIPIVLNKIDLQFFPEGGDWIAGFSSRIGFKALNEFGKPADIEGEILNETGELIQTFKSYHQGMGAFELLASNETAYTIKVTKPKGITQNFVLPTALNRGYALQVISKDENKVVVEVSSTEEEKLSLIAQARGQILFITNTPEKSGAHQIEIPTKDFPIGITQLTLFDSKEIPRSERLVFINSDKKLQVNIQTDKEKYLPREKVEMTIEVKDERGLPMPGRFSLAIADDKLLTFTDDKQGHILSYLLLESDLKGEIEEPNFYFDQVKKGLDKDQNIALDYLLLTQGWRRFSWKDKMDQAIAETTFENENAIVAGKVISRKGYPVSGALVTIEGTEHKTVTQANGLFTFKNVDLYDKKTYRLKAIKGGKIAFSIAKTFGSDYQIHLPILKTEPKVVFHYENVDKGNFFSGTIIDRETGEGLIGANIFLENGEMGISCDMDGHFRLENLPTGLQTFKVQYVGYENISTTINIQNGQGVIADIAMSAPEIALDEIAVTAYKVPLIEQDNTTQGVTITSEEIQKLPKKGKRKNKKKKQKRAEAQLPPTPPVPLIEQDNKTLGGVVTSEEIRNLPTKDVSALAATTAGLSQTDEGGDVRIRGSRADATNFYIDGVRVRGNLIPESEIEEIQVITGGVPAEFGGEEVDLKREDISFSDDIIEPINRDQNHVERRELRKNPREDKQVSKKDLRIDLSKRIETKSEKYKILEDNTMRQMEEGFTPSTTMTAKIKELKNLQKEISHLKVQRNSLQKKTRDNTIFEKTNSLQILEAYQNALNFTNGLYRAREFYAPKYKVVDKDTKRTDFRPTTYWNPLIEVGINGKATVEFYNSDDITTFRATLEGIGMDGGLAHQQHNFFTQLPMGMSAKVPTSVLTGDKIKIPLLLSNHTAHTFNGDLQISAPSNFKLINKIAAEQQIEANESKTIYLEYKVLENQSDGVFQIDFKTPTYQDAFTQQVKVISRGFPVEDYFAGNALSEIFDVEIKDPIENSTTATLNVHTSVLSDLVTGLDRMLRQPSGCFEQTSSSNYPNLLVLDYLQSVEKTNPEISRRANAFLDKGYKRLMSFEVKGGGFDWYGNPPAHEALTAYGLMQFIDMQSVYAVEKDLINRTATWLLSRRDGKGSWKSSKRGLHSWKAKNPVADAYIVWAMTEAGYGEEIKEEVEKSYKDAVKIEDPYLMALMVNALYNLNDNRANTLLDELLKMQMDDNSWNGLTASMTNSRGLSLKVETTSLSVLAMLKGKRGIGQLDKAINFIAASKNNYGFGSTQSTVLAMKALVAYAKQSKQSQEGGTVSLYVDGKLALQKDYDKDHEGAIVLKHLEKYIPAGKHKVQIKFENTTQALPYDLVLKYNTRFPKNDQQCEVKLETKLQTANVKMGDNVRLTTKLINLSNNDIPNTIAVVGIPSGLSLQTWQLKELQEKEIFDFYEIKDGYVVFHYRGLTANETKTIPLDLKADIPGNYEAPASVAYLYYTNEFKSWSKPEMVKVAL